MKNWLDKYPDGGWLDSYQPEINFSAKSDGTSTKGIQIQKSRLDLEKNQQDESIQIKNNPKIQINPGSLVQKYQDTEVQKLNQAQDYLKYYKKYDLSNKIQVSKLQEELVQNGYKLPKYGIDGKFGDETKKAFDQYIQDKSKNLNKTDFSEEETKKSFDKSGCMEYVSYITNNKALGDAWTVENNLVKEGKRIKYNIYTDPRFKNVHTPEELIKTTQEVKKTNKATADMFKVGDVVGLFYKPSNMHKTALEEGKGTYNTHAGVVTSIKDGVPIISHNIHGKLYHQPYNELTIGWIGESNSKPIIKYDDSKIDKSKKIDELILQYTNDLVDKLSIDVNKEDVKKDLYGILKVESNLGKIKPSNLDIKKSKYAKMILGQAHTPGDISTGVGKIKLNTLSLDEQKFLDLTANKLNKDSESVKAATFIYLKNYQIYKEYAQKNPHLGLTNDDIRLMTILSYNQGNNKLSNFGYNKNNKDFNQELQELRNLKFKKVQDISSTKYKYIPVIGQALYNKEFKGGHESYISRVLKYGNEYAKK